MYLSMRWLSDYVKFEDDIQSYIDKMTMSGSKVEGYEIEDENIENVVVGRVDSIVKHPDADTLYICQVDVGQDENVQIVTGADNVVEGALVPVALHKSKLPNGTQIKRGKLRGERSEGMLCSLEELNLTKGDFPYAVEDGIFLLEEDCEVGEPIGDAIGLNDTVVEFEITSNRPDCLAVLGLARETAATYNQNFEMPEIDVKGGGSDINSLLDVTVENTQLCSRYMAAAVENVKIGSSPRWMRERLRASGVRPINNIVDITNYVMLEYGHPMHAFDLRHVAGEKIVVRNAKEGEIITTLDGEERKLSPEMLVIADQDGPSAVAGVMGGEYSGIYDDTEIVIFEAACFDGPSVRRTAQKLNMRTESSSRFEKGLDFNTCELALKRACELVEMLGAGTIAEGFLDENHGVDKNVRIPFKPEWINEFIGVDIKTEEMEVILKHLGFGLENNEVVVPSFRNDMEYPADVAEEVTRIYGYDKIPTTVLRGESKAQITPEQHFRGEVLHTLVGQGYSEIITYSFYSPKNYDKIRLTEEDPRRNCLVIRNPLGEDTSVLRTTAMPSILEVLSHNYNNRSESARMFEIATVYIPNPNGQLPNEPVKIAIGEYGENSDFFTIKGSIEAILDASKIADAKWQAVTDNPIFHPGRCARLIVDGKECGILGQVHPHVAENYDMDTDVYLAEIDYKTLFNAAKSDIIFKALPRYPASTRDIALVADVSVPVGTIEEIIKKSIGDILEKVELFDVYQGKQIGENKKSVAYALILRAQDKTLTDEECDNAVNKALKALQTAGVELRS